MKSIRVIALGGLVCTLLFPEASAQDGHLASPQIQVDRSVQLLVNGPSNTWQRVDVSTNLLGWFPLELLKTRGEQNADAILDTNASSSPMRFYRARQITPGPKILGLVPSRGAPGDLVEIYGQFTQTNLLQRTEVRFGGMVAELVSASSVRLLVRVPVNASTGIVTVQSPEGIGSARDPFIVSRSIPFQVLPPAGFDPAAFEVVNSLTPAVFGPTGVVTIRKGLTFLTGASVPNDTNRVLLAITAGPETNLVLSAHSSAAALVFLSPGLVASDSGYAAQLLQIINTDPKVQILGSTIASVFISSSDPYTNSAFHDAYVDAVCSVVTNEQSQALFSSILPKRKPVTASLMTAVPYSADLEFITVSTVDEDNRPLLSNQRMVMGTTGPRFPFFNSVDWIVRVAEVDVELAFPNGRDDFNRDWRENRVLRDYPTTGLYEQQRNIEAELITERLNPLTFFIGWAADLATGLAGSLTGLAPDESLQFPDRNGLYLVRAIGPGFYSFADRSFALNHYPEEYIRAMSQNIVAGVMDTVGILIDIKSIKLTDNEAQEDFLDFVAKFLLEANKQVPSIASAEDYPPAVLEILKWAVGELADVGKEKGLDYAAKKFAEKTGGAIAKAFGGALNAFDVAGSVGQVAQRVTGMTEETALETGFVVVGDPFAIEVISVNPPVAGRGALVTVEFRGRRTTGAFRIGEDTVWFEGAEMFEGSVLSVSGPTPDGTQQLIVQVPEAFGSSTEGNYKVVVNSRGWRGEGTFRLTSKPEVSEMSPLHGFAATATYQGTKIRLRGVNFRPTNDFSFTGVSGWIVATNLSGTEADVSVRVPVGAISGPIRIVRTNVSPPDEVQTDSFTVLGPPVIDSFFPIRGPAGTMVMIDVQNTGPDANDVSLFFHGVGPSVPLTLSGSQIVAYVPLGAETGPVRVVTPAGEAQFNFIVDPGLASGGGPIYVGGNSVVTIQRAGLFASGLAVPNDDNDFFVDSGGNQQPIDPPNEEGDFVPDTQTGNPRFPLGSGFADTIRITNTVTGDIALLGDHDLILADGSGAKIIGNVLIAGNHSGIFGVEIEGTLTVSGNNNGIDVRVINASGDGLVVTGSGNRITATVSNVTDNGVVITGSASGNSLVLAVHGSGGHGVMFSGNVQNNTLQGSSVSNLVDGLVLDGAGVANNLISGVRNFYSFQADFNGGNGASIINGASSNTFGYWFGTISALSGTEKFVPLITDGNAGHGIFVSNSVPVQFWAQSSGNGGHGALFSRVSGGDSPLQLYVQTGANTNLAGNALAGVRIENNSSNLLLLGSLSRDSYGIQLEGSDVKNIKLGNEIVRIKFPTSAALSGALYVRDCALDGVALMNTSGHQIHVEDILRCGRDGVVLHNSSSNMIRLSECVQNLGAGVRLTENSADNEIQSFKLPFLLANVRSNQVGIKLEGGAQRNYIEGMDLIFSRTHGLVMSGLGTSQNRIQRSVVNASVLEGILLENGASDNFIGPDHPQLEPVSAQNHTNGIARITGRTTSNNLFRNIRTIGSATNAVGFVVENEANGNVFRDLSLSNLRDGIVLRSGAFQNIIRAGFFFNLTGRGILFQNASNNVVGGAVAFPDGNAIIGNRVSVEISGAGSTGNSIANNSFTGAKEAGVLLNDNASQNIFGPANTVRGGLIGIQIDAASENLVFQNTVSLNTAAAMRIENGAANNVFSQNTVLQNGVGLLLTGATTVSNSITRNSITDSTGRGISLASGANRALPAPRIQEITANLVSGEADAPDGSVVEIFRDAADEGKTFLTGAPVTQGRFQASVDLDPKEVGLVYRINATLTDKEGNTSEFGSTVGLEPILFRAAFTTTRDGNEEIYLYDPTLAAPQRVTFHTAADYSPALNRTNVAWVSTRSNNIAAIFVTTLSGFPVQRLTTNSVPDYDPAWFPDNSRLAFVSERDANPEIYVMNANGSGAIRLTNHSAPDLQPSVSPDGASVVFASQRDGDFEIYMVGSSGSGLQRITQDQASDMHPSWSPDGQFIAFASTRDGNSEIYVMRPDGTELQRLTTDSSEDTHATWLPDGRGLVFASDRSGQSELYLVAKEGGTPTRLTFTNGESSEPSAISK